jgi:hypothetical protein
VLTIYVGNGISFCKKFCGLDSERFPLFRGRKCSFRGIPSQFRSSEWNGNTKKKLVFRKESLLVFLVPRNGIPSRFLFRWRIRNGILRVCFYFCYTELNSEHFSLPRKSKSLLLFLFHCTEFFSLRNGLERNSKRFLFHGTAGIPPEFHRNSAEIPPERTKIVLSIPSSAE